jgi:hypothetical protein
MSVMDVWRTIPVTAFIKINVKVEDANFVRQNGETILLIPVSGENEELNLGCCSTINGAVRSSVYMELNGSDSE